jgi:shikimate 5-dehydrogenase
MNQMFGSISASPGKTGTYYYSEFFKHYDIKAEYNSFKANDNYELEKYLKKEMYLGFNISMPFKSEVIRYLGIFSPEVSNYNSCNTIKVTREYLHGFNTDIAGVFKVLSSISKDDFVLVLGNGAIGKMFTKVLKLQDRRFEVISPSLNNWDSRHQKCDVLINCTSMGTSISASPIDFINGIHTVYDLAFNGINLSKISSSINYFPGIFFYKEVFLKQFLIHTNISPDPEYFDYLTEIIR